jgi:hypothetical protein
VNHSVSFSALDLFEECSEKYRLRYRERLASEKIPSPLFFGTAIDTAVEVLLLRKKVLLTDVELDLTLTETAHSLFDKTMREQDGKLLERNVLCDYFQSDFDPNVLKIEDIKTLETSYPHITDFGQFFDDCKATFKAKKDLTKSAQLVYNHMCWLSLYRKGEMLLVAYEEEVLPQIHEVFDIQKNIQLINASGDKLRGKIDFTASFVDDPSKFFIVDNKTSSSPYTADSVANSDQLTIYCEAESVSHASYIVLEKKIRIKDPKTRTQVIKDVISEEQKQIVFDRIEIKLDNIAQNVFVKKDNPKDCFSYGKRCEFYKLCWSGDASGITKRPERV